MAEECSASMTKSAAGQLVWDTDEREFVSYIHPSLLTIDASKTTVKIYIMLLSFLFFVSISVVVICLLKLVPFIRGLPWKSRWGLAYAIVTNIYSIPIVIVSAYHCFRNTPLQRDPVEGRTKSAMLFGPAVAGYFLFDLAFSLASDYGSLSKTYNKVLTWHHFGQITMMLVNVSITKAYGILAPLALLEVTAPFLAFRDFLKLTGLRGGRAWRVTLFCIIHIYHVRNIIQCYSWFLIIRNWQNFFQRTPVSLTLAILGHLTFLTFYFTPYVGHKFTQMLYGPDSVGEMHMERNESDPCQPPPRPNSKHCD